MDNFLLTADAILRELRTLELRTLDDLTGWEAGYVITDTKIIRKIDGKSIDYTVNDLCLSMQDFSDRILRPLVVQPRGNQRPEQVRGTTHGDYTKMAVTAQNIKIAMRAGTRWDSLTPVKTEALHMIATKLARIVCGDSDCLDHWADIAGYANLVKDRIPQGKG